VVAIPGAADVVEQIDLRGRAGNEEINDALHLRRMIERFKTAGWGPRPGISANSLPLSSEASGHPPRKAGSRCGRGRAAGREFI